MFQSCEYIKYDPKTDEYIYKIIDDEFEEIVGVGVGDGAEVGVGVGVGIGIGAGVGVAKAFSKKGFDINEIGRNIALLNIYIQKEGYYTIEEICKWQDYYIEKYEYIENWDQYKEARDRHLQLFNLLS